MIRSPVVNTQRGGNGEGGLDKVVQSKKKEEEESESCGIIPKQTRRGEAVNKRT